MGRVLARTLPFWLLIVILPATLVVTAWWTIATDASGKSARPDGAGGFALQGRYAVVNTTRPNSLAVVNVDVYSDFACAACRGLYDERSQLLRRYPNRLVLRQHFVATRPDAPNSPNEPLRLYLAAARVGRASAAADALMKAGLDARDPAGLGAATERIAKELGLQAEYRHALTDSAVTERISQTSAAAGFIRTTPAIVINSNLLVPANIENASLVIDSLLSARDATKE